MRLYRVNEVARELGCSEAWLRRAERDGRIPQARRDMNGWRVYDQYDITRLREFLIPTNGTERDKDAISHEGNH